MLRYLGGRWGVSLAVLVLALTASCGGATSGPGEDGSDQSQSEELPPPVAEEPTTETAAEGEEPMGGPSGECDGIRATGIETNTPLDITMFGNKQYLCVSVPEGVTGLTFEISELTGGLDLFVGYGDLATLEAGGEGFWASDSGGRDDKSITIEPGPGGFVAAGTYFIEVSGGASADGATYVLMVDMPVASS